MNKTIEGLIDWDKFEASSDLSNKLGGMTPEHLEKEIEIFESLFKLLEPIDFKKVKKEIADWKIEIPNRHSLTFENIAKSYSDLSNYRYRISQLVAEATAWDRTCKDAVDTIKKIALPVFTAGTDKVKEANAALIAAPFVHLKTQTEKVYNYLIQIQASIDTNLKSLDLILKERQSQSKLNHRLGHIGEGVYSETNDFEDVDEDGFKIIKKTF